MTNIGLSAVILAKNEEENLPGCLELVRKLADEIILIDDCSSDKTVEIAKKAKVEVFQRRLDDFSSQRNFALEKVKTPWVLFIDPDEEVSPELAQEIKKVIQNKKFDGFQIPRKNIIFGKWIKHSGWYPDWQLHLFKKEKGKYVGRVHEQVEIKGKVGELKNFLLHKNYQSISQYLEKLSRYTSLEKEFQIDSGYKFSWQDLIKKPLGEFLRRFFAEEGYKDGVHGLALSLLQAFSELVVYLKIWEKEGFKDEEIPGVFEEIEKATSEINWWIAAKTKNPIRKILNKLR